MKHYDVLLIHPSAQSSSPQFIIMPVGMISLMNELKEYSTKAVNVGLELCLDKTFDLETFLRDIDFDVVGIDLHWHEHTFTALEIAQMCKKINPNCLTILGGLTASYFAQDILHEHAYVDVVVSGEAEETVPHLLKNTEFSSIPNLVYRDNGIKKTPVKPPSSLDGFDFSDITRLHHWEEYLKCSIHAYTKTRFWYDFWLCTGRGCIYECSYCGGARSAQKNICGREGMTFRSVDAVITDLIQLQDMGVHVVCPSHDIFLAGTHYWEELFDAMKREQIYMGMYLEVWQLPNKDFIKALGRACDPRFTTVAVTLLSGSETVRMKNGKYFSNSDYFACIKSIEEQGMNHVPYFASGLPFETGETFKKTLAMTEKLLTECNPSYIFCTPLRLDPGSPMYEHPDEYGVVTHYRSFKDYYNRCRKRAKHLPFDYIGYHTKVLPGKQMMSLQHEWDTLIRENPRSSQPVQLFHFL